MCSSLKRRELTIRLIYQFQTNPMQACWDSFFFLPNWKASVKYVHSHCKLRWLWTYTVPHGNDNDLTLLFNHVVKIAKDYSRNQLFPLPTFFRIEVDEEIRKQVDELMRQELKNLKMVNTCERHFLTWGHVYCCEKK